MIKGLQILILVLFSTIILMMSTKWEEQYTLANKYKQSLIEHEIGYYDITTGVFTIKDK